MARIEVLPFHGSGRLVVIADVAHELSLQIGHRGKDAASDDVTLDLGEPQFDLVEPRAVGRSEVQVNLRMLGKEGLDQFGLVSREIVGDDMDLLAARLVDDQVGQKGDELSRGMPSCRLAEHYTGLGVEGRIQRERPMALVLKPMPLGAPRRQRQHRIESIQGLDRGLLIHADAACAGGFRYSPMMSAAFFSKSGSSELM